MANRKKKKSSKVNNTSSFQPLPIQQKITFIPVLWIISLFMTFLTIYYAIYAIKYSTNLIASSLILMILGSLAFFTSPHTLRHYEQEMKR